MCCVYITEAPWTWASLAGRRKLAVDVGVVGRQTPAGRPFDLPARAAFSISRQPVPAPLPTPQVGNARFATGHFLEAAFLFKLMVTSTELEDFLTLKVGGCSTE